MKLLQRLDLSCQLVSLCSRFLLRPSFASVPPPPLPMMRERLHPFSPSGTATYACCSRFFQIYAQDLLVVVVVMTYACVAPVVLIPALMFFGMAQVVYRHQLL